MRKADRLKAPAWAAAVLARQTQMRAQRNAAYANVARNFKLAPADRGAEARGDLRSPVEPVQRVSGYVRRSGREVLPYLRRRKPR